VDDERLAGDACGTNVVAKTLALPLGHVLVPIVVEPRLADRDDARMLHQLDDVFATRLAPALHFGMDADRRQDVRPLLGQGKDARQVLKRHADANGTADTVARHGGDDLAHPL